MDAEAEVKHLAELARVHVAEADLPRFAKEFEHVLAYVGKLGELSVDMEVLKKDTSSQLNVFREDGEPHEAGKYTEAIAAQFPKREGNALSVKQIISHD